MPSHSKKPARDTFAEWCHQGLTSMDVQERTGASAATVCRWGKEWNLELARGAWGGNRKPDYVAPQQEDWVMPELPLPATSGRLGYWQSQGLWMMGEAA